CIQIDGMGMRFFLAGGIGALAPMLHDGRGRTKAAGSLDRQARRAATPVSRRPQAPSGFVHHPWTSPASAGCLLFTLRQFPRLRVERKRGDGALFLLGKVIHFADSVEELLTRMNGKKRRAGDLSRYFRFRQLAGVQVKLAAVNAFALRPCI